MTHPAPATEADDVFEQASELFGLMSSPIRLRIASELCREELNVTQLLDRVSATQPNAVCTDIASTDSPY